MTIDEKVLDAFYDIVTESKQEMLDQIASDRTNYVTIVMETVMKEHNASAVLRSCDCFGIQHLHAIEKGTSYEIQRDIAKGAGNWIDLHTHMDGPNPTADCLKQLKDQGYKIVATTPHTDHDINDIDISQPIALVFGTERDGISEDVYDQADELVKIPMYGFTESYNISVSAAIALNIIRNKLEHSKIDWRLTKEEQLKLKIDWCSKIVNKGVGIEKEIRRRFLEKE
ncbi:MAG: RNA methyltransferase [Crocinitomicaceae bacterium]|nr:RNA methyltransferase [Crocinitomicaceae bacterium]